MSLKQKKKRYKASELVLENLNLPCSVPIFVIKYKGKVLVHAATQQEIEVWLLDNLTIEEVLRAKQSIAKPNLSYVPIKLR